MFLCTTWKPFTFDPAEVGSIDDNGRLIFVPNQGEVLLATNPTGSVTSVIIRCSIAEQWIQDSGSPSEIYSDGITLDIRDYLPTDFHFICTRVFVKHFPKVRYSCTSPLNLPNLFKAQ
jgi:hypothetical protein